MSTSDQNGHMQLTRKQLRELRLTGSTPVISEQEASDAAAQQPAPVLPRPAEPAPVAPAPAATFPADHPVDANGVPLTRRQIRELERLREAGQAGTQHPTPSTAGPDAVEQPPAEKPGGKSPAEKLAEPELVSEVPTFAPAPAVAPTWADADAPEAPAPEPAAAQTGGESVEDEASADTAPTKVPTGPEEAPADEPAQRPMVGEAFGLGVKRNPQPPAIPALFDDLIEGDSAGSHRTPTALIYTHAPGVGSLSGPVASTGELLITGSYELPEGLGSQGHALGTTDGKDIDAVLIDGELAPSSSPTPIAASSAISTSRPAGEVIRPPAPEKGNRLMLTLAIVAGGLAIALAAVLIVAFTTNVFG
ncbi:hypothetical protein [Microbacterium sp.]|uniref:hypothetical protein n=1 Tax=Microbacterium sp. TaxID=51671 RepID=UPI0028113185|nr:hypothetical protein [Microbacterium sp.]